MRISDWSSDVCSSDLRLTWRPSTSPALENDMTIGCSTTEIELASLARWTAVAPPIGAAERRARLAAAQERMTEIGAAALLVNAGPSLRYFTGVAWAPSERLVAMRSAEHTSEHKS